MTYNEFCTEYERIIKSLLSYNCNQVGSIIYAEKAGVLADTYPEFMDRYDNEN